MRRPGPANRAIFNEYVRYVRTMRVQGFAKKEIWQRFRKELQRDMRIAPSEKTLERWSYERVPVPGFEYPVNAFELADQIDRGELNPVVVGENGPVDELDVAIQARRGLLAVAGQMRRMLELPGMEAAFEADPKLLLSYATRILEVDRRAQRYVGTADVKKLEDAGRIVGALLEKFPALARPLHELTSGMLSGTAGMLPVSSYARPPEADEFEVGDSEVT